MLAKAVKAVAAELALLVGEPPPLAAGDFAPARAKLAALMCELGPRHQKFVASVLSGNDGKASAISAGYAPSAAAVRAHRLLRRPQIAAVMALAKRELAEVNSFNVERAMVELDDAINFAKESKQANALVKAIELRARLHGLLIDRSQVDMLVDARPSIRDAMNLAQARMDRVSGGTIDAEFQIIDSKVRP